MLYLMRSIFLLLLCSLIPFSSLANEIPTTFKEYKKINLSLGGSVYISPEIKYTVEKKMGKLKYTPENEVITFGYSGNKIELFYDSGPSDDPSYFIQMNGQGDVFDNRIFALRLFISPDGTMYADGDTNSFFNAKRKYVIESGKIVEIKQPYYLVDEDCVVNESLTITANPCSSGETIAKIPKGQKVHILLSQKWDPWDDESKWCNDKNLSFLVSTSFGLVGWAETAAGNLSDPGRPLSCITYSGD